MTASIPEPRQLRWYQHEAVDSVYTAWESDPLARPGVVLPTGTGKEQPVTTPVPTPYGIRLLGDLQVGDHLAQHNHTTTTIKSITRSQRVVTMAIPTSR